MGIFSSLFGKKSDKKNDDKQKNVTKANSNEKLVDGELPWGWVYANKDFIDKIQNEYNYFLNNWISSKSKGVKEEYSSLKSFVLYIKDVRKLVYSMNECFVKWYDDIIGDSYLCTREKEMKYIEENYDKLIQEENQRREKERFVNEMSNGLEEELLSIIKDNPGILQSDVYGKYGPVLKDKISEILYFMNRDGKITREKNGRSYNLYIK